MKPTKPASPRVIASDTWVVQSPYGALKTRSGEDLVRLEEVHALLCESGKSPHDATREIFSPFYMECLDAAESEREREPVLLQSLYFANALAAPDRFVFKQEFSKQKRARFFASAFPALEHVRLQDGTMGGLLYSMAEGALRVWHGKADIATDRLAMVEARREAKTGEQYGIRWPDDADLRSLLGRLAVPFALAHSLWGWGRIAEVVSLHVVPSAEVAPTTWAALVTFRKANPRTDWTVEQKIVLSNEFTSRRNAPGAKGVAAAMAAELPGNIGKSLSVKCFNELKAAKSNAGKRALTRQRAA